MDSHNWNPEKDLETFKKDYNGDLDSYAKGDERTSAYILKLAIEYDDLETVKKILSINRGNILTHPDKDYYSPISSALICYRSDIWNVVADYIQKYKDTFVRNALLNEDGTHILTEIYSIEKDELINLIEEYLVPLYRNHEDLRYIYQCSDKPEKDTVVYRISKQDLDIIKNSDYNFEQFMDSYARENQLEKGDYLLSWILSDAIVLEDIEVIEKILSANRGNILYHVNGMGYSSISYLLYAGNQQTLYLFRQYIKNYSHTFVKANIDEFDAANIISIMYCPKFEELSAQECLDVLLEPVYQSESLKKIRTHVEALTSN